MGYWHRTRMHRWASRPWYKRRRWKWRKVAPFMHDPGFPGLRILRRLRWADRFRQSYKQRKSWW